MEAGLNFCLVTNECTLPRRKLAEKLNNFGYKCVDPSRIISPAPTACSYLELNNLRPRLHVWHELEEEFASVTRPMEASGLSANCLVIGDLMNRLSRDFIDESLEIMLNSPERPVLVSLGAGRYYKDSGRLRMDTGAYTAAFEYSLGVKAVNIGKPSESFFGRALELVGGSAEDTIMIGDDIVSDVGGAKRMGMRGFLVRTGKYKASDESGHKVKADCVFANLAEAADKILAITSVSL